MCQQIKIVQSIHCGKLKVKPHTMYYIILFSRRHPILRVAAVNHSPPLILLNSSLTASKTFLFFLFSLHTPSE